MQKESKTEPKKERGKPTELSEERRGGDRRKASSAGYAYIPMVGWYCRREETRRDDDDILK